MPSERLQKPVLVLNASYEPINVCAARRALVLVLKGVASAEEVSVTSIHSARNAVRLPSVIRLLEYRRIPHQTRALSRKNILMRDRYTCQYCQRVLPSSELTLDHVVPRSRSGETVWENLVACCHGCNNRKGNRTPEEAGGGGEPGGVLPRVQQPQRKPDAGRGGAAAGTAAESVQSAHEQAPDAPDGT